MRQRRIIYKTIFDKEKCLFLNEKQLNSTPTTKKKQQRLRSVKRKLHLIPIYILICQHKSGTMAYKNKEKYGK
jgi:hypothetical protein